MRHAVEASVSRAKALGATSNLYIVEGEEVAYVASGRGQEGAERFLIATRSERNPWRVGYLSPGSGFSASVPVDTLWPRPNVGRGWWGSNVDGTWCLLPVAFAGRERTKVDTKEIHEDIMDMPADLVLMCPECGGGDVKWDHLSLRPYCKECNYWPRSHCGTASEAVLNWNQKVRDSFTPRSLSQTPTSCQTQGSVEPPKAPAMSKKIIRVRIAVAMMENGDYQASGWVINGKEAGREARNTALECAESYTENGTSAQIRWVEADVPAYEEPEEPTIEGVLVQE